MANIYTAQQASAELGIPVRAVQRIALARGIGSKPGRDWVFTGADLRAIKRAYRGVRGNPNFTPGNHFGKPPEKS